MMSMTLPQTAERVPAATPDRELLDAWAGGEEAAFAQVVQRYQRLVVGCCRRQLGGADAEDAAQAVFLVLARKPRDAARAPNLPAWLIRTARFVCANARRAAASRVRAERESALTAAAPTAGQPDELLPELDRELERLPRGEREAVVRHYLLGQSHAEVAGALACPVNTVYSHLHRGLLRLRERLARRRRELTAAGLAALLAGEAGAEVDPSLATRLRAPDAASEAARRLATETLAALRRCALLKLAVPVSALLVGAAVGIGVVELAPPAADDRTSASALANPPPPSIPAGPVVAAVRANDHGEQDLVMLSFPPEAKPREGDRFTLRRGDRVVVTVRAERVTDDLVAARVLPGTWNDAGLTIQQGDLATSANGDGHAADPGDYLPAQPRVVMRFNDLARSRERWKDTPYAQLAGRPWVQDLLAMIPQQARAKLPASTHLAALGDIRSAAFGIGKGEGERRFAMAAAPVGDGAALRALFTDIAPTQAASLVGVEGLLCYQRGLADPETKPDGQPGCACGPLDPAADAEMRFTIGDLPWVVQVPGMPPPPSNMADLAQGRFENIVMSLDAIGVREHGEFTFSKAYQETLAKFGDGPWTHANLKLLTSLPPTTLCAVVMGCSGDRNQALMDPYGLGASADTGAADAMLQGFGLPDVRNLMSSVDGDALLYVEQATPFPTINAVIGTRNGLAERVLEALDQRLHLVANPDGSHSGSVGPIPLHAAAIGGTLVVTTSPAGCSVVTGRSAGFADLPDVRDAIAELDGDAYIAGVSRSGELASTLARLAALARPSLAAAAEDLRHAGRHGYISVAYHKDRCVYKAGGLIGYMANPAMMAGYFAPSLMRLSPLLAPQPSPTEKREF
jgi:RNA polymerase sigma factor (sigma-70 family)